MNSGSTGAEVSLGVTSEGQGLPACGLPTRACVGIPNEEGEVIAEDDNGPDTQPHGQSIEELGARKKNLALRSSGGEVPIQASADQQHP